MIGRLRGELVLVEGVVATLDVGGVGYDLSIPASALPFLPPVGSEAILLVRQIFREDGQSLYGFVSSFQRRLFDLLLGVKGCGPKVALALLGVMDEDSVAQSIQIGDTRALARAPGLGVKIAERIVLELKDKMTEEMAVRKIGQRTAAPVQASVEDDLVAALVGLGYRRSEAEAVADQARSESTELQDQIKAALQLLKK